MFCAVHSDPMALEINYLTVWPEDLDGNRYTVELAFDHGKSEQNLAPVIMDIIGTACPFVDTAKFRHEYLCCITFSYDQITLSYSKPNNDFDGEATVDFTVSIAALMTALDTECLNLGVYFLRPADNGEEPELCEAYNISFGEEDGSIAKLSISTEDHELDAFLVEENAYLHTSLDDDNNEEYEEEYDDDYDEDDEGPAE